MWLPLASEIGSATLRLTQGIWVSLTQRLLRTGPVAPLSNRSVALAIVFLAPRFYCSLTFTRIDLVCFDGLCSLAFFILTVISAGSLAFRHKSGHNRSVKYFSQLVMVVLSS